MSTDGLDFFKACTEQKTIDKNVFINKRAQREGKQITIQNEMFIFRSTGFQLNDRNGIRL